LIGRQLRVVGAADASGAGGAQEAYESLIFQKKVDALISMETSAARNAGLPIVSRGKVPFIYTSFYEGRSCNKYMYINAWVPDQQVAPMVDFFMKDKGSKTFFLIGSDYAFGRGMLEFTRAMPDIEIVPNPVFPEFMQEAPWWQSRRGALLIASEYSKYLAAMVRPYVPAALLPSGAAD